MTQVRHFIKAPHPAELYARAAVGAVLPSPVWGGGSTLPDQILEQWDIRLDESRADAYRDVTGFPVSTDLPDTFPSILGFGLGLRLMTDRSFPLKALGMVHIYDQIDVLRPLSQGETVSVSVSAKNLRPHRKGALVDLVSEVRSRGELVWTEMSTYLSRGSKAAGKADPSEPEIIPAVPDEGSFEMIAVPENVGRQFAGVSKDRNPIHLHAVPARAFGFPRAIAHGRWTMARSLAAVAGAYPHPAKIQTWFRAPVHLPSTCLLVTAQSDSTTQVWLSDPNRDAIHVYTRISAGLDDQTGPARP